MEQTDLEVEILQNKVEHLLSNKASKNQGVLANIARDNSMLTDYIMPLGKESPVSFYGNGDIKLRFNDLQFSMHDNALRQIADKFEIPQKYMMYLNSTQWGRKLAENVLTNHKDNIARNRVLVRTVDGQARAVLSDKYRRLNSDELYQSFIVGSNNAGAKIYDAHYTETKSYISTIIPKVFTINTENNGQVHSVFGARMANSDYGNSSLSINAFQMNVVCLNGMVSQSILKQIHLGKRLPDNINFSEATYKLDTQAMASAVDDIMKSVLDENRILLSAETIKKASATLIDIPTEIVKLNKMGMTKDEVELVEAKLLQNNPEDGLQGLPSKWKLSQAVTAVSNDIGETRKQELDELAGKLIKL